MRTVAVHTNFDAALSCFNFLNCQAIQSSYDSMTQLIDFALTAIRDPLYREVKPLYSVICSELLEKPLAALLSRMTDAYDSVTTSPAFLDIRR